MGIVLSLPMIFFTVPYKSSEFFRPAIFGFATLGFAGGMTLCCKASNHDRRYRHSHCPAPEKT
jgi:hypothetical protein